MTKRLLVIGVLLTAINCNGQNYYDIGLEKYYSGRDSVAIHYFNLAIDNNQNLSNSYMMRGAAQMSIGNFFKSTDDVLNAIRIDSNNARAYFYYGRIYFLQGFYSTAIKYYDVSIVKNSKDPDVYDDRAMSKLFNEDYISAINDENYAIKLSPQNSDYYNTRGYIKMKSKNYEEAIKDFDLSLGLKSRDNPKANANKGLALFELGKFAEAIKYFSNALLFSADSEVLYYRGRCYLKTGNNIDGCKDLRRSFELGNSKPKDEAPECFR